MNHLAPLAALVRQATALTLPHIGTLSDTDVIEAQRLVGELRRVADARAAVLAGEIGRRSRPELGYDGLAQRLGARTPQELVQKVTGVGRREASTLVSVGALMDTPDAAGWERAIGSAIAAGAISTEAARVIRQALAGLELGDDVLLDAVAELLVVARTVGVDRLATHARQVRDRLDSPGVVDRERKLWDSRFVNLTLQPNGMTKIYGLLDPESAAEVRAVVDAATSPRRGGPRFVDPAGKAREQRLLDDPRSVEQITLDALVAVLKAGATSAPEILGAVPPAVRVHVTAADLNCDDGAAHLEGQTTTVSIATAKRHICTAGVIPIAFDDAGQVVNLGRTQRVFTHKQRIGLAARDGGCRFPDCDRPPGWTEAHHINEWDRDHGRTDIADGISLCRHHHMLVHNNGWQVTRTGADYFVTPPPAVDPRQHPIAAPTKSAARVPAA